MVLERSCGQVQSTNLINVTCVFALLCFQFSCGILLQRSQRKLGFHRDLVTYLEWDVSRFIDHADPKNCTFLLVEHFPSGLYIDQDQVRNGEEFGGPKVLSKEVIDVESLAHHSSSNVIYVFPKTVVNFSMKTISANISIPVHLRYHQAALGKEFVSVSLSSPTVFGRCDGITGNDIAKLCGTELIKAPCNAMMPSDSCDWVTLKPTRKDQPLSNTPLVFHVPVGQIEHRWLIIAFTLLSTIAGCSLVLWNALTVT